MAKLFEYSPAQRKLMAARNDKIDAVVTGVDHVDFGVINGMFLSQLTHAFLEEIGKYFLFPIAAGAHVVKTILAWRKAWLDRKQRSVVSAIVETVATAAIVAAVVGALVANGLFALATPIMFTAALGGKTLFHAGSAIYYAGKASAQTDQRKKEKYRTLAKTNGFTAAAGTVATAAVVGVFLLGKFALAAVGVVAAVLGTALVIYKGYRAHKAEEAAKAAIELEDLEAQRQDPELQKRQSPTVMYSRLNDGKALAADAVRVVEVDLNKPTVVEEQAPVVAVHEEQVFAANERKLFDSTTVGLAM